MSLDNARAFARVWARAGGDPQEAFDDLRIIFPQLSVQRASEVVSSAYRSIQEEQIRNDHDRTIVEAIEEGVLHGPESE